MLKAILFDLDGTLLQLDEEKFIKFYFGNLGKKFSALGFDSETLLAAVWRGTKAMRDNSGEATNETVFWPVFYQTIEGDHELIEKTFLDFYQNEFDFVRHSVIDSLIPAEIVRILKEKNYRLILATNPLFPSIATFKRISWAGLDPKDFEFISTYENSYFSKPNINYFRTILNHHQLLPEECMMIGNDAHEDMIAGKLGLDTYLLTNCLNNEFHIDINQYKNGKLEDLLAFIKSLPDAGELK